MLNSVVLQLKMMNKMMDIVYLVVGNIIAGALVHAAMTGWEAVFMYAIMAACDVAFVYNKFRGRKV